MLFRILAAVALALASSPAAAQSSDDDLVELGERTITQLQAYVMSGEGDSVLALAHPSFRVVLPIGIVESRGAVAATAGNVRLTRFDQRLLDARRVGDTAIVLTRADAEGTVAGNPFPARILMSHIFAREDGEWRLVHRQMTAISVPDPAFERALAAALAGSDTE